MAKTRFGSLDGIHEIKKGSRDRATFISVALFIVIIVLFLLAVSFTSKGSVDEQKEILSEAIDKGIMQCYITEGRYPESFEYLQENYGIVYDEDMFRVDYVVYGTNMKPDVTIIQLEE